MKVWLVYVSGYHLRHVCSTEEIARKRFDEIRQALLLKQKETLFPKDLDHELLEDDVDWANKNYKYHEDHLNSITFDSNDSEPEGYTYPVPHWEVWEVE